jgi:regulator of telomere elongation helicase 1
MKTPRVMGQKTQGEWPLFPYDPYPQQLAFMKDVTDVVGNGGILVAEACNGFGKTVSALASLLPVGRRIVYATRTHEQVRQVLLELERINQRAGSRFTAVTLASRRHLCLNEQCRKLSALEAVEACRLLKEAGKCRYITGDGVPAGLPLVLSTTRLQKLGRARGLCPYFLARRVAERCTVIVAPYQYIFNEHIRSLVQLELNGRILVFDEAHNADHIGQDVLSDTLSEYTLDTARREVVAVNGSPDFLDDLTAYLAKRIAANTVTQPGLKLRENLTQTLGVANLAAFAETYGDIVDEIRNHKTARGDNPVCFLNGVLSFLKHVAASPSESYVAVYRTSFRGYNLVEYRCLDPSLAIGPVVKAAAGALIMSGTLSVLELFTEILGLETAETRNYAAIADPENVHTIIDPHVTTRYAERGEAMTRRYGERIARLITEIPNGTLIFFPQRRLLQNTLSTWKRIGLMGGAGNLPLLGGKPVFVEGAQAGENRQVVEAYKQAAKSDDGAVLCGVFRGRNAEGSNFPYAEARGIILVGVPYADYSDPVVKAQINYYNRKKRSLGERWYVMDAFRAVNQAMGRGIRHRDDWCHFILMDRRYLTHQSLLSTWAVANGVHEVSK